jgi:hypothetical protein
MDSLNRKILNLENKIRVLESKLRDITRNKGETPPVPHSKLGNMNREDWFFLRGNWCTYSIYSD